MADDFATGYMLGNDSNNNGGFLNGEGIWAFLLFALMFNGGWGNFGGGNAQQGYDTRADIQRGFDNQAVISKLDGITQGICDSTYALNNTITNGFNNTNMGIVQGFNGVERGFYNISSQIAECCCGTQRAIDGVKYQMATDACALNNAIQSSTRDIIDSNNAGTRAILDFLTQDKIATLTAENQSLRLQASQTAQNAFISANQEAQTAELIRRLGVGTPVPAYIVNAPTPISFPANTCGVNCGC